MADRVKTLWLNSIKEELTKTVSKNSKVTLGQQVIVNYIKDAIKNPGGMAAREIIKALGVTENLADNIDAALNAMQDKDNDFLEYRIVKRLHKVQRDIFIDIQNKQNALFRHGRRFGKTHLLASIFVARAQQHHHPMLYIGQTSTHALNQMWNPVVDLCKALDIPIEEKRSIGEIVFPTTKVSLRMIGNSDVNASNLIRGYHFGTVCIDEIGTQRNIKYLIDACIKPALGDHAERLFIIAGTPPPSKIKYLEYLKETFVNYTGKILDNDTIPHDLYYEEQKRIGDTNTFKREWDGEWITDTDALVWNPKEWIYNESDILNPTNIICGVDWGYEDYTAFAAIAYNKVTRQMWLIKEDKFNHTLPDETITRIETNYKEVVEWAKNRGITSKVYIQIDHDNKSVAQWGYQRGLPFELALKTDTVLNLHKMDDNLRSGNLLIPRDGYFYEETEATVWKRDKETDELTNEMDDIYHPDIGMAILYAFNRIAWELKI